MQDKVDLLVMRSLIKASVSALVKVFRHYLGDFCIIDWVGGPFTTEVLRLLSLNDCSLSN